MSVPRYHHYLPSFYQSRWAGVDGRLRRYSMPYGGKVDCKWVYPAQSGGEYNLYSDPAAPAEKAQGMESDFMSRLDSLAHDALTMLETGDPRIHRESGPRSAWSRFLMSLMMRMPNDMATLKTGLVEEWARYLPELEQAYQAKKQTGWPATFAAYMDTLHPNELESWAISVAPTLMDHSMIGELINNMRWFIREISGDAEFLTSDRPLISLYEFAADDSYIMLPIGPKAVFVAVNNLATQRRIEANDPAVWVESMNRMVVGAAKRFVFGTDDSRKDFVREHLGKRQRKTLFEMLVEYRKAQNSRPSSERQM
ncbi:DUF4238 domain-containing protein [Aliihoeflea sp. PC F10.4]|jgi:hypothetical protein